MKKCTTYTAPQQQIKLKTQPNQSHVNSYLTAHSPLPTKASQSPTYFSFLISRRRSLHIPLPTNASQSPTYFSFLISRRRSLRIPLPTKASQSPTHFSFLISRRRSLRIPLLSSRRNHRRKSGHYRPCSGFVSLAWG